MHIDRQLYSTLRGGERAIWRPVSDESATVENHAGFVGDPAYSHVAAHLRNARREGPRAA